MNSQSVVCSPYPPREPLKVCEACGTRNEASRTICINPACRAALPDPADPADPAGRHGRRGMSQHTTFAELWESLPASTRAAVEESVAAAPPIPAESADVIRRVFVGSGQRLLARREAERRGAA